MSSNRSGNTESRHRGRREAKKPAEITRDEYRTVAANAKTIPDGRAAVLKFENAGLIRFGKR